MKGVLTLTPFTPKEDDQTKYVVSISLPLDRSLNILMLQFFNYAWIFFFLCADFTIDTTTILF
jgi:hypothetical protein